MAKTVKVILLTAVLSAIGWCAGAMLAHQDDVKTTQASVQRVETKLSPHVLNARFAYLLRSSPPGLVQFSGVKGKSALVIFNVEQWDAMSDLAQRAEIERCAHALYTAWTEVNGDVPDDGLDLYIESRTGQILSYTDIPNRPTPLDGGL